MKHSRLIQTAACGALLLAALAPRTVLADEWDKKTNVHFSGAVQVPGMTLQPGDYVFRLLESPADRYIVQIYNKTEQHLFTTLIAIPNYKLTTPEKVIVSFYEAPSDQPPPLKAWFYPGDNYGRQFVYKKGEAQMIAKAAHESVPTGVNTVATAETQTAEATTETPVTTPEPAAETPQAPEPVVEATPAQPVTPEPAPVVDAAPAPVEPVTTTDQEPAQPVATPDNTAPDTSNSMPTTGSEWPLAGLIGLSSVAGALLVRAARKA